MKIKLITFAIYGVMVGVSYAEEDKTNRSITMDTLQVTGDMHDRNDQRVKKVSTATKVPFDIKDIPQSISSVDVEHAKLYGQNDLSVILSNIPGIDTTYDMRDEGIMIRGFSASSGDIYRDGVRMSGQVRQSTANIERIEVLKGPASVLYGRGSGGGVVNMISRQANFSSPRTISLRGGSWDKYGGMIDLNQILSDTFAVRLTVDHESSDSFRKGINQRGTMISPSFLYDNHEGLSWLVQYTHDDMWRKPDRGPSYTNLPPNVSHKTAFAHPKDYIEDRLRMWRSVMEYKFNEDLSLKLTSVYRKAEQNFDHLYNGIYCKPDGTLSSNGKPCNYQGKMKFTRAWQETTNKTLSNTVDFAANFNTGFLKHETLLGVEYNIEKRSPSLVTSPYAETVDPYRPHWTTSKPYHGKPTSSNDHKATSQAIYWQDLISFTPEWKLLLGLRYDHYEFNSKDNIRSLKRSYNGNTLSPRTGLIWQPVEEHSFYVSYSKNFAPYGGRGTINIATNPAAVFDDKPQYSRQYEVGVKSDWFNDKISTQLAIYDLELYNVRYQPDSVNDPYNWQVRGKDGSRGIELSAIGQITQRLYINSGIGYQQAKIREDKKTAGSKGKYLANTAKHTGYVSMRFLPHTNWFTELGLSYKGSMYNNAANSTERPGYGIVNAAVGYQSDSVDITLAMTNLLGKEYWRSSSMPGTPRAFLVTSSYKF